MNLDSLNVIIGANISGLQQGLSTAISSIKTFSTQGQTALNNFTAAFKSAGVTAGNNFAQGFQGLNSKLTQQFKDLEATQDKYAQGFGKLGGVFKSVGEDFTKYVTLPIAAGFALSGKAAVDFESAFAGVKKTLNTDGLNAQQVEVEYARLSDGIRKMATEIPAAATEIAKVAESAGQLGIQRSAILDFTRVMIDLGNSTNLSGDQAATSLARLANITKLPQTQFSNLGSAIVALGNNFATTESDITELGLRLAGAGKQVNLTEADILGFSAALSSVGINAEAGGTAFSTVLKKIQVAVETGGKTLSGFARVAGQSSAEFAQSFKTNASRAVVTFIEGLGKIKEAGGSTIQTLSELGLGNIRTSDSLLRLANAGDLTRRAVDLAGKSFKENTALAKEAGQRYETTASQIQIAKNRLTDLGITIGNQLLPAFKTMASVVGNLADGFQNLSPGAQKVILVVGALAAALGPLALGIGSVIAILPTAAAGFSALGAVITFATGPIGLAIVAIGALAAGLVYLSGSNDRAVASYQKQAQATNALASSITPLLNRYDELTSKSKLTNAEQTELETIVKRVATAVPSATSAVDAYGKAAAISTTKTREFITALKEQEKQSALQNLPAATAKLKDFEGRLAGLRKQQQEFNKSGKLSIVETDSRGLFTQIQQYGAGSAQVQKLQSDLANLNVEYLKQKELVDQLNISAGKVTATQKLQTEVTKGAAQASKEASDAAKAHAKTLGELKDELKDARALLDTQVGGTKEFEATKARITSLEALIKKLEDTGKAAQKTANEIQKAFQDIRAKLQGVDTRVKLGIELNSAGVEEKIKIIRSGIDTLTDKGVRANNPGLLALQTQLIGLQAQVEKLKRSLKFQDPDVVDFDLGNFDTDVINQIQRDLDAAKLTTNIQFELDGDTSKLANALADAQKQAVQALSQQQVNPANPRALAITSQVPQLTANAFNTDSLREYNQALKDISATQQVYGVSFNTAGAQMQVVGQRLKDLIALNKQATPEFAQLTQQFQDLKTAADWSNMTNSIASSLGSMVAEIGTTISDALADVIVNGASGQDALNAMFNGILGAFGGFLQQLGTQLVTWGVMTLAAEALAALGPAAAPAAIALGLAAIAAGSVFKAISRSGPSTDGSYTPTTSSSSYSTSGAAQQKQNLNIEVTFKPVELRAEGATLRSVMQVASYRLHTMR